MVFTLLLSACQVETITTVPPATRLPSAQPSPSPVTIATPTPTSNTQTTILPSSKTINAENAANLRLTDSWGYGRGSDLAWSPDGRHIAVAASSGLLIFDAQALALLHQIPQPAGALALAYSPSNDLIACGAADGAVNLYSTVDFSLIARIATKRMFITALAFSADGRQLAVSTWDNSLQIFNIPSAELVQNLAPSLSAPLSMVFEPNGKLLLTWGLRDPLIIWDLADNSLQKDWYIGSAGEGRTATAASFSADSAWFAAAQGQRVRIFDTAKGTSLALLSGFNHPLRRVALSADGSLLATLSGQSAQIWRSSNGALLADLPQPVEAANLNRLAFDPRSARLAALGDQLIVWQLPDQNGAVSVQFLQGFQSGYRQFSRPDPQSDEIMAGLTDGRVMVQSIQSGLFSQLVQSPASALDCLDISADRARLVYCSGDNFLNMAEIASPGSPTRLRGHTSPPALARFSPDGKVLVSAANDRAIRVWDGKSGESLQQLQLPAPASSLEFSDQGAILAASDGEQTWLWNTSDWSLLQQVNGSRPQFSGDGSLLATARINAARQQMIDIYTLGVDHPVRTITAEGNWFGFSSDGALLAVAGAQISLWDTSTQTLLWQVDNALTGGRVWFTTQNDGLIISGGDGQLQIYSLKN